MSLAAGKILLIYSEDQQISRALITAVIIVCAEVTPITPTHSTQVTHMPRSHKKRCGGLTF